MKHQLKFHENKTFSRSRINLETGDPIWIHATRKGIIIKKSRSGFMGPTLFKENNLSRIDKKIQLIDAHITELDAAFQISGRALRVFTHLVLLSKSAHGLSLLLHNIFPAEAPSPDEGWKSSVKRGKVIADFIAFVEDNYCFGEFRDVAELPHNKQIILEALTFELAHEENFEKLEELRKRALMLVNFQENVGPKPLNALGMNTAKLHGEISANKDDLIGLVRKMAENPDRKKYVFMKKKADRELHFIHNRIISVEKIKREIGSCQNGHC